MLKNSMETEFLEVHEGVGDFYGKSFLDLSIYFSLYF